MSTKTIATIAITAGATMALTIISLGVSGEHGHRILDRINQRDASPMVNAITNAVPSIAHDFRNALERSAQREVPPLRQVQHEAPPLSYQNYVEQPQVIMPSVMPTKVDQARTICLSLLAPPNRPETINVSRNELNACLIGNLAN